MDLTGRVTLGSQVGGSDQQRPRRTLRGSVGQEGIDRGRGYSEYAYHSFAPLQGCRYCDCLSFDQNAALPFGRVMSPRQHLCTPGVNAANPTPSCTPRCAPVSVVAEITCAW